MEKVLFWYGAEIKELDKDQLLRFLAERSHAKKEVMASIASWEWKYNSKGNLYRYEYDYFSAYDFILRNLAETTCIQIYSDGVIRLHLKHGHYETPQSIYLNDYKLGKNKYTAKMLKELKTYAFANHDEEK